LHTYVGVELNTFFGDDTVIVVDFEAVIFEAAVNGTVGLEGEPHFQLLIRAGFSLLLGCCLF